MIRSLCGIGPLLGREAKLNKAWLLPLKVYPFTFNRTNLIYHVAFQENFSITRYFIQQSHVFDAQCLLPMIGFLNTIFSLISSICIFCIHIIMSE